MVHITDTRAQKLISYTSAHITEPVFAHFSFFFCDLQVAFNSYILKQARNMIFFYFKFLKANFRGGKGVTFIVGPGRHLASLRHWVGIQIVNYNNQMTFPIVRQLTHVVWI